MAVEVTNGRRKGDPVDYEGKPAVDPTQNVKDLADAAADRQDDLRTLTKELFEAKCVHIKELGDLREKHQRQLARAESARLDSIRQVDREDVNKTAAQALGAIQILQAQTNTTAETLRAQVANTAATIANQLTQLFAESNKRLSALELSGSEGRGKQLVTDPQMDRLASLVEKLVTTQATGAGKSEGVSSSWAILLGVVGLLGGLLGIAGVLYAVLKP